MSLLAAVDEVLVHIGEALTFNEAKLPDPEVWARPSDGNSDVLYVRRGEEVQCIGCPLVQQGSGMYVTPELKDAVGHIERHLKNNHRVPGGLIPLIRQRWSMT